MSRGAAVRRAALIALTAWVPAWCLRTVFLHEFLFRPEHRSLRSFAPFPAELGELGLDVVLAVAVVLVLSRSGRGRSEFWWLAGGLFVAAAAATSVVAGLLLGGGYAYLDLLLSTVSGYWLTVFFVGARAWWHWMPTYPPASWTRAPVIGVDYDDDPDEDADGDDER